jgi:TRAP-type C4-dicarboxylate transport system permease small subunit
LLARFSNWTSKSLLVFAATLGFLLSFLVVADVIGRVVFNSPVKGTPELVSTAIVIICFMQAPYAIRSGGMIYVDFVVQHFSPRAQSWLAAAGALLGAAFLLFIVWGSYGNAWNAWMEGEFEGEGALRVPAWPARLTVVVGCALGALNYVLMALSSIQAARRNEPPPPPPALG